MDLIKTGKFIAEQRKTKKLTQTKLAEIIGVSEKTISKWECGNGFPDTSLILPLCTALDITANELLSCKLLPNETEYKKIAEQNIINLKNQQEKNAKYLLMLEWIIGAISILFLLTLTIVASYCELATGWRISLILLGFIVCIIGVGFCLQIEKDAGFYECEKCKHKYIPSYKQVFCSMHIGRTRFMKCPKCHEKSWNKKTTKCD